MRPSRWGAGCELSQVGVAVRLLLVEMGAWSAEEAQSKAEALAAAAASWPESPRARIYNHEDAESVWKVRESADLSTVFGSV